MRWGGQMWNRNTDLPKWIEETDFDLDEYGKNKPRTLMYFYNVRNDNHRRKIPIVDHTKRVQTPVSVRIK